MTTRAIVRFGSSSHLRLIRLPLKPAAQAVQVGREHMSTAGAGYGGRKLVEGPVVRQLLAIPLPEPAT